MTDLQELADRVEIASLPGVFTDAGVTGDWDHFASLFTEDGRWRLPHIDQEFVGREAIRAAVERLQGLWDYFVQTPHPGRVEIDGDNAVARSLVAELGRSRNGNSMLNYAVYHDRYRRTADGWKFSERLYELRYLDTTPLPGSPPSGSGDVSHTGE